MSTTSTTTTTTHYRRCTAPSRSRPSSSTTSRRTSYPRSTRPSLLSSTPRLYTHCHSSTTSRWTSCPSPVPVHDATELALLHPCFSHPTLFESSWSLSSALYTATHVQYSIEPCLKVRLPPTDRRAWPSSSSHLTVSTELLFGVRRESCVRLRPVVNRLGFG